MDYVFRAAQDLLQASAETTRFFVIYTACLLAVYAASVVYGRMVPPREPRQPVVRKGPSGASPIQRWAKSVAFGFADFIASLNISPNQVTLVGLALVVLNCGQYLYHQNSLLFGSALIVSYLFDTLDGVVARAQGTSSRFGGYLDAVVDRYQEVVTYLAVGWVTDLWLPVFLAMTGSMLTSYNKARAAIEVPVDNKGWPDLLGKPSRLFILCTALILNPVLPWMIPVTLWGLAIMTHFTALQRVGRGYFLITSHPAGDRLG